MSDIRATVRQFITENFLLDPNTQLNDADSLLQLQIVDSTGFLELVNFVESTFGIKVADEEMVPENLESIDNIVQFLGRKLPV
jgi:acyl carrier protein